MQAMKRHERVTKFSNSLPTERYSRPEAIMRASKSENGGVLAGIVSHWAAWAENRRWNN